MVTGVGGSMARQKKAAAEHELNGLAEDWVALWQSEIAGLMADPELAAAWGSMAAMGNAWLRAMGAGLPGTPPGFPFAPPRAEGRPTDDPTAAAPAPTRPARPAPAAAPPDAGRQPGQPGAGQQPPIQPGEPAAGNASGAERMAERLAELERRLAEVELRPAGGRAHRRGTGRRRPST